LFDATTRRENPSEFLDETYPAETKGMGLPSVETGVKELGGQMLKCVKFCTGVEI